jgi:hypothetical protein
MRVILEKKEIVQILSKHFESNFDAEQVLIRTEPVFEIELKDIPLPIDTPAPRVPNTREIQQMVNEERPKMLADRDEAALFHERMHGDNASLEAPQPGADGFEGGSSVESPQALIQASKELDARLKRENPHLYAQPTPRREGVSTPPDVSDEEMGR